MTVDTSSALGFSFLFKGPSKPFIEGFFFANFRSMSATYPVSEQLQSSLIQFLKFGRVFLTLELAVIDS